ncbi:hypothetical protein [Kribbella sp. NPDC004536]|uniref:hypothetical protein n=1 Tax=Kribbella sp. NPDC004536 TaxID=3364106 RepID=UPI0036B82EE4
MNDTTRRAGLLAAMMLAAGLLATGCGSDGSASPGVADITPSAGSSPTASASSTPDALGYSACMRSHGVKNFPDPNANGEIVMNAEPGNGLDMNDPTFKAAEEACKALRPGLGTEEKKKVRAEGLQYAKCIRAHGVKSFPDPPAGDGPQVQSSQNPELNPDNPKFKAAQEACKALLPSGGDGPSMSEGDGK